MVIVKRGKKYYLFSRNRKKLLGVFNTQKDAVRRERQIRYFKSLWKRKQ